MPRDSTRRVALLTLGCARNEVDSEELAARLADGGWAVSTDGTDSDVDLLTTCAAGTRRGARTGRSRPPRGPGRAARRCSFCAIPTFRGAFVSRTPDEILAEAEWLASTGVRELVLVSENSTSYGKDLGDPRLLERLLPQLAPVRGIVRVRVSYLQPADTQPGLVEAIARTPASP